MTLIVLTMTSAFLVTRMMGALPRDNGTDSNVAGRVAAYVYVLQP